MARTQKGPILSGKELMKVVYRILTCKMITVLPLQETANVGMASSFRRKVIKSILYIFTLNLPSKHARADANETVG